VIHTRAGSVSVFEVGIGIRYFRRYFFHVGSVFGIGILIIIIIIIHSFYRAMCQQIQLKQEGVEVKDGADPRTASVLSW